MTSVIRGYLAANIVRAASSRERMAKSCNRHAVTIVDQMPSELSHAHISLAVSTVLCTLGSLVPRQLPVFQDQSLLHKKCLTLIAKVRINMAEKIN